MATNGESARQWLAEHGQTTSPDRLARIRQNIESRLTELPADHEDAKGLLEALDVMDHFITTNDSNGSNGSNESEVKPEPDTVLDYSPLIPQNTPDQPVLSAEEKQARFQQLLQQAHKKQL